ncbi:MAG: hypothetical protein Kow0092_39520 [Deferrisomatales bacterium]
MEGPAAVKGKGWGVTRQDRFPSPCPAAHVPLFAFFGGAPGCLVPHNLKSGVKSPCFSEPDLNATHRDLAVRYGCAVVPAHGRKPRGKAKVEAAVLVAERWILARLMRRSGLSRAELFERLADPTRADGLFDPSSTIPTGSCSRESPDERPAPR